MNTNIVSFLIFGSLLIVAFSVGFYLILKRFFFVSTLSIHQKHEVLLMNGKAGLDEKLSQKIIESRGNEIAKKMIKIIFNEIQSLSDIIVPLKLDYVNPDITEQNFPMQQGDNDPMEYKVFHFGKSISSEIVIKEMGKENYRPATLRELLRWAKDNWNGLDRVIALGQTWFDAADGGRHVVVLDLDYGVRELDLGWFGGWGGGSRFLAVRK